MSLLEFAKNNKEYLNLFTKITDNDSSTRSETVETIIKQLNTQKEQLNNTEDLNTIPLIKYTIQRLIRGLTSSSHVNRIAFANALSQILIHCKWLTTSFILSSVNTFCSNEKAKQSSIIESLLLIRNLFILILFQTQRIYELSWDNLNTIMSQIVSSKQAKNLIDLSCQSMICLFDIMENKNDKNENENYNKWKQLLINHQNDLLNLSFQLIPSPINSFKLITLTQIKLILRIYNNYNMFSLKWKFDNCKNKTIVILPNKINLIYEFILKPLKQSKTNVSISMISNIYNDKKMWNALISLYCLNITNEEKQKHINLHNKFAKCCNELFYFINNNLLKPKYVSFVSILCNIFISVGIDLKIKNDILFANILNPSMIRFITKYGLKYKNNINDKRYKQYKNAFDFMIELKELCNNKIYGSRVKSILISSNINIEINDNTNNGNKNDNNSKLKTINFCKDTFWTNNSKINENTIKYTNELLSCERECVNSMKSISNMMQEFTKKYDKNNCDLSEMKWLKQSIYFFVRIVFFKADTDIINKTRFEKILFSAKKSLRIFIQNAWNTLTLNDNHRNICIDYFSNAVKQFKNDKNLSLRMENDNNDLNIEEIVNKIDKINMKFINSKQKNVLKHFVKFIGIYYFMNNDTSIYSISILSQLNDTIINKISHLEAIECGEYLMDIIVKCIESDDMFISCLSRHILLEFGDLFNSQTFDKLLIFISPQNQNEIEEIDMKNNNQDIDMNTSDSNSDSNSDSEASDMDEDSEESEQSDYSDDFDVTDYGAFVNDINLETDTVKSEELAQLDKALVAVFREREKQSKTRINAKKMRIQKRVFHHIKLFVKRYKTSPIILIMFPPLMMSFWNDFNDKISKKNKNKQDICDDKKENDKIGKKRNSLRTASGIPLWRFDNKYKENEKDVNLNIYGGIAVINEILLITPNIMVENDKNYNEIKIEWLKDLIYDVIEIVSESITYKHEIFGIKVLCYLCKIYELKCSNDSNYYKYIWDEIKLNENDNKNNKNNGNNKPILWLLELWYFQLKCLMKQPRKTWYFSKEFFEIFMRKNAFICWKLISELLNVFDICKNDWSQTQIFSLIGTLSDYCYIENDNDNKIIKYILCDMINKIINPLKECLNKKSMEPSKKMAIVQNIGVFVKRLKKYKIDENQQEDIVNILDNSKLKWKKIKSKKKKRKNDKIKKTKKKWKMGNKNKSNKKNKNNNEKKRKMKFKNVKQKSVTNPKKKRRLK